MKYLKLIHDKLLDVDTLTFYKRLLLILLIQMIIIYGALFIAFAYNNFESVNKESEQHVIGTR